MSATLPFSPTPEIAASRSVFHRLRQQRQQGLRFEPTPIPAPNLELPRTPPEKLGVYAPPIVFADCAGVSLLQVTSMLERGELSHLRLAIDGPMVHVRKGLATLEQMERGLVVASN